MLAYLFLSSCLCDFGQFWAHTLLIPHLLHGKRLLSLLSLEFNARKELWANSEQEAQFPGSTAQFCKCTKKKQTDAQFSPSAYSLRLSGWFLQCLNHQIINHQIHQIIPPDRDNTLNQSEMFHDMHTPYESAEQSDYSGIFSFITDYILLYVTQWCCGCLWLYVCEFVCQWLHQHLVIAYLRQSHYSCSAALIKIMCGIIRQS